MYIISKIEDVTTIHFTRPIWLIRSIAIPIKRTAYIHIPKRDGRDKRIAKDLPPKSKLIAAHPICPIASIAGRTNMTNFIGKILLNISADCFLFTYPIPPYRIKIILSIPYPMRSVRIVLLAGKCWESSPPTNKFHGEMTILAKIGVIDFQVTFIVTLVYWKKIIWCK